MLRTNEGSGRRTWSRPDIIEGKGLYKERTIRRGIGYDRGGAARRSKGVYEGNGTVDVFLDPPVGVGWRRWGGEKQAYEADVLALGMRSPVLAVTDTFGLEAVL
jgi:hypothetical protein